MRVQQLTGPAMAKGLEDTALYRYNRLIALNEVGSEPGAFTVAVDAFHRANAARLARTPRALLATSTHDTKRGEDARARIAALTGHAAAWRDKVFEWHDLLADPDRPIDRNEEYFFYQLLLGAWPADGPPDLADLTARVQAAMLKSVREAGVNTRWVFGDPGYEAALAAFVARALDPAGAFLPSFRAFEATIAPDGAANGLIQTALKLTIPGVPDIYQGAELWDQSLVDPDNRRPVDFARRAALLADAGRRTLQARADRPPAPPPPREGRTSSPGAATSRLPTGPGLCAFARRHGPDTLVVAAALRRSATAALRELLDGGAPAGREAVEVYRDARCAVRLGRS